MQPKLLLTATLFSLSSFVTCYGSSDDTNIGITGLNDKQASAFSSYQSALTNDKQYTSFSLELKTVTADYTIVDENPALQSAVTGTATALPTAPTELPEDAQKYISSVYKAELSIITKYRSGNNAAAAPTGALIAAGAAAVGVMGFAAM